MTPSDTAFTIYIMNDIAAIDFGSGNKFRIHTPNGPLTKKDLKLPKVKGGSTEAGDFIRVLSSLFDRGYTVVLESASIGSSGAEKKDVVELMRRHNPYMLQTISGHAVKNHRRDNNLKDEGDAQAAKIIYEIATTNPKRLKKWKYIENPIKRKHTSVRPMDKRGYKDERAKSYLSKVPELPEDVKKYIGTPAMQMPFLMAFDEEGANTRNGYMGIVGCTDQRYPSFYSRKHIDLIQEIAKDISPRKIRINKKTGKEEEVLATMSEVTREKRREACRIAQRIIRNFYRCCKVNFKNNEDPHDSAKDLNHSPCS